MNQKQLIITQDKNLEIKKEYTFDGLFEIDSPKELFYERTTKPIIEKVLKGYNGIVVGIVVRIVVGIVVFAFDSDLIKEDKEE